MSNKYELIRSKETGCPICIFDNENQVRVCTFNSSNAAIESEAVKALDGLNETATLHAQIARMKQREGELQTEVQKLTEVDFKNAAMIDKLQLERDEALRGVPDTCSPVGQFKKNEMTHGGEFKLSNGATLAIFRTPDSWAIIGHAGDKARKIALTNEAMSVLASVLTGKTELTALQSVAKEGEQP